MSQDTASGKTAAGDAAAAHGADRAVVVSQWAKEFDIDALLGDIDSKTLVGANSDAASSRRAMVMEGRTVVQDAEVQMQMDADNGDADSSIDDSDKEEDDDDDDDAMEEDVDGTSQPASTTYIVDLPDASKTKAKASTKSSDKDVVLQTVSSSRSINAEQRKLKKKQAKLEARALANAANNMMADQSDDGDDSYDFGTYFKQPVVANGNGQTAEESDSDEDL
ncbi:hypothetical protein FB639_005164 [Coemansia asiatica]|nr:hypothetical protein FB639_005164 [Coemansia asiatica]